MDTALVCASDLHTLAGRRHGPCPCILGHETVSRLVERGHGAPEFDVAGDPLCVGDRVVWGVVASCGKCARCTAEHPQKCVDGTKYGHVALGDHTPWSGGFAEFQRLVPGTAILTVPTAVPSRWAAMVSCSTATVAAVMRVAGDVRGKRVVVNGGGNLGAQAVLWAVEAGAGSVICVEPDPDRQIRLATLGAQCAAPGEGFSAAGLATNADIDIYLELAGHVSDFSDVLKQMAIGGTIVFAGAVFTVPPVTLDMETVVRKCLVLRGMHNYAPLDLVTGMRFMERHWQRLERVLAIAEPLPLADFETVFALARSGAYHRVGFHGAC